MRPHITSSDRPISNRPIATCHPVRRTRARTWLTDGGDPQRTAWQKNEHILNVSNVKGMKLLWKYKTDNEPREMHALFPPLIVGRVLTAAGPKQVAIVAGISDNIYAIDVATGGLLWKHHFDTTFSPPPGVSFGTLCPGGQLATPVIGPGKTPGSYIIYAAAWDGRLHQLDVATGKAVAPSALFMPPNGKPYGLNLWNNVVYTTSAQGCGGNPNYVYAFDLATRRTADIRSGQRRHVGTQRSVDRQGRDAVHRHRRRFVQPRASVCTARRLSA